MVRIGQTNKWNVFIFPIVLKGLHIVRTNSNNCDAACCELCIVISHARQLRAAVWSQETTQEGKQTWVKSWGTLKTIEKERNNLFVHWYLIKV